MFVMFLFSVIVLASSNYDYPEVPDTNGSLCNPETDSVREYRYEENIPICNRNVSSYTKRKIYEEYGVPSNQRNKYTIDHIIPLSISGSNHRDNLWPQHKSIHTGNFEYQLYLDLLSGNVTHHEAICLIVEYKNINKDYWNCN